MTKPNSDKSGRAARRRKDRKVTQAQRTIAREGTTPSVGIDINALMAKMRGTIGALTVERDALSVQLEQRDAVIAQLGAQLAKFTTVQAEPPELGEVPEEQREVHADPDRPPLTATEENAE